MKKILLLLALLLYLAGIYYLTRPDPILPDLNEGIRSDEPGDTFQHPDQAAYYTDRNDRAQILGELQNKFNLSSFSQPSYRLNYRPEEVGELVRDQLRSYYLEEVIHPLRESVFINILDPAKSPMIDDEKREQAKMYFKGRYYPIKVTLRPVYSVVWGRLMVWTFIFPLSYLVFLSLAKAFNEK